MISYAMLAQATGKTEEQVREDKKNQLVDLDSLTSVVEYVATATGWVSPAQAVIAAQKAASKAEGPLPTPTPSLLTEEKKKYSGTSTVHDNVEPSGDPYLDRAKSLRAR